MPTTTTNQSSNYPLALSSWGEEEYKAFQRVIDSNIFSMGKEVKHFEEDYSKYMGTNYTVMVNSGSSANLLAIAALFYRKENPLKQGDEVIVPAVSWSTTYTPLQQYGLKVKFVDVDLHTLNYDLDALQVAVTDKTKLIVVVNLLGNSNDFSVIEKIANQHGSIIFEDNCESLGAEYNGKKAGAFGLLSSCSSFFSHHISTMEGGLITTNDEELYHILLSIRSHGWTRHLPKENHVTGTKSDFAFEESFKFVLPGYNVRPLEMSGALGVEQLKKLPSFISKRRENAQLFLKEIQDIDYLIPQTEIGKSSWFGFSMIVKPEYGVNRDSLVKYLTDKNIDCRPIVAGNFTKNEVIKYFNYELHGEMKNAEKIDRNGFFVGNHHIDMRDEINHLIEALKNFPK